MAGNFWDADPIMPTPPPRGSKGGAKAAPQDPHGEVMETPKDRDVARAAMARINQIEPQLNRVEQLYRRNFAGGPGIGSVMEYVPAWASQTNAQFDSATGELQKLVKPTMRVPGEGAQTDFDARIALQALPKRQNPDASNEEALRNLRTFVNQSKANYAKQLGLPQPPPSRRSAPRPTMELHLDAHGNVIR